MSADDTCDSIVNSLGLSIIDFVAWNPQLDATALDCSLEANNYVCVEEAAANVTTALFGSTTASNSAVSGSQTASSSITSSAVVVVATPTPTQTGMVDDCKLNFLNCCVP